MNSVETTMYNCIAQQADRDGQSTVILAVDRPPLTYAELQKQIIASAQSLQQLGIGRHDRVALVLPNGPEMAVAFLAVSSVATCAPLNPTYTQREFAFYLTDLQAKALIVLHGSASPALTVARQQQIPIIELCPLAEAAGAFQLIALAALQPRDNAVSALALAQPTDVALLLHTSGTTARPKLVPLTQANLCASAAHIGQSLQLTPNDCGLNVMPLFHIHGLIAGVLAPLQAGGSVVCTPGFAADHFFTWLTNFQPTWYTAVPTMHQAILAQAEQQATRRPVHRLRLIRSSSASLPPPVLHKLEDYFQVPVIEAYGMTEAAHQMTSNPLPPQPRKVGSVGPAAGPQVAIMSEADNTILPTGAVGEVVIQGANVTAGYLDNAEANAKSFVDGWFRTGDQGYLDAEGYLFLTGRLKEIINRGGEKVAPRAVDEVLLQHPAVAQAVTFAVPHPTLGEDVAAAVVLKRAATGHELRQWTFRHLTDNKVPTQILIVDEIPKGATGKLQRIGLAQLLAAQLRAPYVAPANPREVALAHIWCEVLQCDTVGRFDNFFALGGDSLLGTQVVTRIGDAFQVACSLHQLFAAPTLSELAASLDQLQAAAGPTAPMPRRNWSELPVLSFAQQRLWFLHQLQPASVAYNDLFVFRLDGPLQLTTLQQSLTALVQRHASLRTSIRLINGEPRQMINTVALFPLPIKDLRHLPPAQWETVLAEAALAEYRRPFDLTQDLLCRAQVLHFGEQAYALLLTIHHMASDGWSKAIFWRELNTLYTAFGQSQPSPLPALPLHYADYALWQRQSLQGATLATLLAYWQKQLAGLPELLTLPLDFPRPAAPNAVGASWRFPIAKPLTHTLKVIARQQEATLFMLLLAAFQVLLARHSGQRDIAVGTPIAGRQHADLEGLIGIFVNTLVLRSDLADNPPFRALLQQVRHTALAAYAHQALPFEQLVEAVQPARSLSYHPLFQTLFTLQNEPQATLDLAGLQVQPVPFASQTAKFDLALTVAETAAGLVGELEYDTALFREATIARMADHFCRLLEGIAADLDCPIEQLPMLSPAEYQQIVVDWNQTQVAYPSAQTLHHLFEAQVARTPDAIALVMTETKARELPASCLTYLELNERANQVAHYLHEAGVGAQSVVGLCIERSSTALIGILAILKCGAAYLPLDPTYPPARIAFMLADSNVTWLLAQTHLRTTVAEQGVNVCYLDDWSAFTSLPMDNPTGGGHAEDLAYIMYTSGSTGQPKGIRTCHRNVVRLVQAPNYAQLSPTETLLQFAPLTFDAATFEIWGSLLHGSRLVIAPPYALSLAELGALIREQQVTTLWLPAGLFHLLVEERVQDLSGVRQLLTGGDVVSPRHAQQCLAQLPGLTLINGYGPTENTTFTCCYPMTTPAQVGATVAIGRPIQNTQIYVLDEYCQPLPIGVVGELYTGGDGVALGYQNQPALTAERFIPNPFGGGQLYKTGDLARYRADGTLEFLGRSDQQVKVRGFRVELSEVESALNGHPAVQQSVVMRVDRSSTDQQLVAYWVAQANVTATAGELSTWLKARLPAYMIPSRFVMLTSWPLTANGKVDRRALPSPDFHSVQEPTAQVVSRTSTEQTLMPIWCELLKIAQIGTHDDFFQAGGHSLLVIHLLVRVEQQFQQSIVLRDFLFNPTIAHLATLLDAQEASTAQAQATSQTSIPTTPIAPEVEALHDLYDALTEDDKLTQMRQALQPQRVQPRLLTMILRLPQPVVMQFITWAVQQPWVQRRYLRNQTALVQRFLAELDGPIPQNCLPRCLFFGFVHHFKLRNAVFQRLQAEQHTMPVVGLEMLTCATERRQPIILLNSHTYQAAYFHSLKLTQGRIRSLDNLLQQTKVDLMAARNILYTSQLALAHQTLQQGGIISIAPDVNRGRGTSISVPFHGRLHEFRTSFAELALLTNAQIFFVASDLQAYNRFSFELIGPFDMGTPAMGYPERVQHLMNQYVAHLRQQWSRNPWALPWWLLREHLAYPPIR